ncbi:cation:dicarboxylase symporter family transporter [Vibrio lentus]|nr:cation:dicarboxylase symporter family transporter [Vibrio lentus]
MPVVGYARFVVAMLVFLDFLLLPNDGWLFTGISPKSSSYVQLVSKFYSHYRRKFERDDSSNNAHLTDKLNGSKSGGRFRWYHCATMNMSGVSIYIALATMFVAKTHLVSQSTLLTSPSSTILLPSIGAGGVPGGGVVLAARCSIAPIRVLPPEGLAIVAAV